ncbi:MAG: serine hydrolase domain-containing protein [Gammaproteobacteria bacterium]
MLAKRSSFSLCWFALISLYLGGCSGAGDNAVLAPPVTVPFVGDELAASPRLTSAVDSAVVRVMADEHLPGVAVVVVRGGKTIMKKGYGLAHVGNGVPVDPDKTLFRIGSVSKALTALALARLAERPEVDLQDEVAAYFPGFEDVMNTSDSSRPVRLWHLMTHTGGFDQIGLDRHIWQLDKTLAERKALRPTLQTFLRNKNLRRVSSPGQYFRYDTYGISLAGAVLESATGKPYAQAMRDILFEPAGMTRTFVEVPATLTTDLARGYGYVDGDYVEAPYEVYVTTPASSIDATPADMGRLLEALTGAGRNTFGRVFEAPTAAAALAPQFQPHPGFPGITHGLFEQPNAEQRYPVRSVWHGGSMLGYLTSFTVLPELNLGYFIVTNRDSEAGGGDVTLHGQVGAAILDVLGPAANVVPAEVPARHPDVDLSEFAGEYVYGVYCHTCTPAELARGGWGRGPVNPVTAQSGALKIREALYRPVSQSDVFVREDGKQSVYFGRDANGRIATFSYASSPDVFEKIR